MDAAAPPRVSSISPLTRLLNLLSSVRFGVLMLVLLASASMIGMLIVQQNVDGFEKYFADLTPAQRLLYGSLGFFDIYHAWYFNVLLLVLSLNIVLASIDRFPGAWKYLRQPKLDAVAKWVRLQPVNTTVQLPGPSRAAVAAQIAAAASSVGLKPIVTERGSRTVVLAQRGTWNRLGAYAVHVALLTIFTGGFLTAQFGRTGQMPLKPGTSAAEMSETVFNVGDSGLQLARANAALPFTVECTDIQQTLIKKDGPITADNTIDWMTRVKVKDETGTHEALVHLNHPYDYRGYRFFQASFIALGQARNITVRLTPEQGGQTQDVTIPRDGSATLADGTNVKFVEFHPDFRVGGDRREADEGQYNNPAAVLSVTPPGQAAQQAYAFNPVMAESAPFAKRPVAGYTYRLVDFEKVPEAHILAIQKDPGSTVFYLGSAMLCAALLSVFLFSHKRYWAVIEERGARQFEVVIGGNSNRNLFALEDTFKKLTAAVTGRPVEESNHE